MQRLPLAVLPLALAACDPPLPPAPTACPPSAPCAAPSGVDGTAIRIANVFDTPVFDAYYSLTGGAPVVRRAVTSDPNNWAIDSEIITDGRWPALGGSDVSLLCRTTDDAIRCLRANDGGAWAEGPTVRVGDARIRPLRAVAVLEHPALHVLVLAEAAGVVGLYDAIWDGGTALVVRATPLITGDDDPSPAATAWEAAGTVHAALVTEHTHQQVVRPAESDDWTAEPASPGLSPANWLTSTSFYGEPWVWRSP